MWYLLFRCDNWRRSPEISLRASSSGIWLDKKVTRGIGSCIYLKIFSFLTSRGFSTDPAQMSHLISSPYSEEIAESIRTSILLQYNQYMRGFKINSKLYPFPGSFCWCRSNVASDFSMFKMCRCIYDLYLTELLMEICILYKNVYSFPGAFGPMLHLVSTIC
jgi:hypothetical protein